jgi:heme exporter protein D
MMLSFTAIQDFLRMGGYADYVWSAYGITLAVLAVNVGLILRKQKRVIKKIRKTHVNRT